MKEKEGRKEGWCDWVFYGDTLVYFSSPSTLPRVPKYESAALADADQCLEIQCTISKGDSDPIV
jgi:hypothetical protein